MHSTEKQLSVVIAGSTARTLLCAQALAADPRFVVVGVLTPTPRPIGRKKILTKNPMQIWAEEQYIPIVAIENKIDESVRGKLSTENWVLNPDYLLVVDFGYILPRWLLELPTIAPVNIHPSLLPRWRGSSPGQFVLAFGEKESAVTIMVMDEQLDHGSIITQLPFTVGADWTTSEYYAHAFALATKSLPDVLVRFSQDTSLVTQQPDVSPTQTARMLSREDGFVPYQTLTRLLANDKGQMTNDKLLEVPFLSTYSLNTSPQTLYNLWRGLSPWPGLWTLVDGKRMKLLTMHMDAEKLILDEIQIEGENPKKY